RVAAAAAAASAGPMGDRLPGGAGLSGVSAGPRLSAAGERGAPDAERGALRGPVGGGPTAVCRGGAPGAVSPPGGGGGDRVRLSAGGAGVSRLAAAGAGRSRVRRA